MHLPGLDKSAQFHFLLLLLVADAIYLALHLAHVLTPYASNPLYSLEWDRGYGEVFMYTKTLWVALLLGTAALRGRQAVFAAWALLFLYVLVDDALLLHEQAGLLLRDFSPDLSALGLRGKDFGELAATAGAAILLLGLIALCYFLSGPAARKASRRLLMLLGVLVFFAVGIDMLHIVFLETSIDWLFGLVEDGGELVTLSVICAFVFGIDAARVAGRAGPR